MAITVERLQADIDVDPAKAVAGLEAFEGAVAAAAKDHTANLDVDTGRAETELVAFDAMLAESTRDRTIHIGVDKDRGLSEVTGAIGELEHLVQGGAGEIAGLGGAFEQAGSGALKAASDIGGSGGGGGGFVGALSSAGSAASGFVGALGPVATALGGLVMPILIATLVTVLPGAFAAAAAGAAVLVGALVPLLGLLGAIPVAVGGLAAVFGTLGAVFIPVIQGLSAYGQATKGAAAASNDLAQKQHAVVMANQALASATHQVSQAEQELADARKNLSAAPAQAEEALRQAHFSAQQAALNERQAVMALIDAQKNLKNAQDATSRSMVTTTKETDYFTGKVYEVATASKSAVSNAQSEQKARLAVRQAELNLKEARDANAQAQMHLRQEEAKGIKGSDIMVAARRRLAAAEYSVKQAHQSVANAEYQRVQAEKALHDSAVNGTAATQAWTNAQKNLTKEGVDFVKFIHDDLMPVFFDISKAGQRTLLPDLESGMKMGLKYVPLLKREVGDLGGVLGGAFDKFMAFWTKPAQMDTTTHLLHGLNRVIGAGLQLITPFSDLMAQIATDATPMVVDMLQGVDRGLRGIDGFLKSDLGKRKTIRFFDEAGKFAGLWWKVLKPIPGIFVGISNAVQPLAVHWLKDVAGFMQSISDNVNSKSGQKTIFDYVSAQLPAFKVLGDIFGSIIHALFTSTEGGKNSSLYKFLVSIRDDLLPPIERLFKRLDKSTWAADLTRNLSDLAHFAESVDWKTVGDDLHAVSTAIHDISTGLDKAHTWSGKISSLHIPVFNFWTDLHNIITAFGFISDKASAAKTKIKTEWGNLKDWFSNTFIPSIGTKFTNLGQGIYDAFRNAIKWIKEAWREFTQWIKDHTPDINPLKNLPDLNPGHYVGDLVKHVAGHWSGGAAERNKPILVGEKGAELFIPSTSGRIMPASPTKQYMESTAAGIDPHMLDMLVEKIAEKMKPDVKIEQVYNEKVDPKHMAAELAWELAG